MYEKAELPPFSSCFSPCLLTIASYCFSIPDHNYSSLYDVLIKDDLSKKEIKKLKKVAKYLLEKIKNMLAEMDHPFDKKETEATLSIAIRDILWENLPASYPDDSILFYRDAV